MKIFLSVVLVLIFAAPVIRYFSHNYYWIITRGDSLLLGVLIAYGCQINIVKRWIQINYLLIILFMIIMLCLMAYFSIHNPYPGHFLNHFVVSLFYGGLIVLTAHGNIRWLEEILSNDILVWFGRRSYSIYLVHWLVLAVLAESVLGNTNWKYLLMVDEGYILVLLALIISLLIAEILFRIIESPMISVGYRLTNVPDIRIQNKNTGGRGEHSS